MVFETITNDNWMTYAMKSYDNPTLEKDVEFNDDLKRFKYLKRLFRKYELTMFLTQILLLLYYCLR